MSTVAIPFEPWCVDYHKVMVATAEVAQSVRKSASVFQLAVDLWAVDRRFRGLLSDLNKIESVPPSELGKFTEKLEELHSKVAAVMESAARQGYTNRTITAGGIRSIQSKNQELEEIVEGFKLSMNLDFQQDLTKSWEEYQRDLVPHAGAK